MKKKIAMVILATCLFGTLAGCEKDSSNKPEVPSTENSTNSVNQTENSTEKSEGISALSNANLVGTVIDFTETGCTLGKGSVTEDVIRQIKRCRFHQIKTGLSEHLTMG